MLGHAAHKFDLVWAFRSSASKVTLEATNSLGRPDSCTYRQELLIYLRQDELDVPRTRTPRPNEKRCAENQS